MTAPDDGVPDDRLADWHPNHDRCRWQLSREPVLLDHLVGIEDKQKEVER